MENLLTLLAYMLGSGFVGFSFCLGGILAVRLLFAVTAFLRT